MPAFQRNFNSWEKRMAFIYCSFSKTALATRNGCSVTSWWITEVYQEMDEAFSHWEFSFFIKHASHKVRKNNPVLQMATGVTKGPMTLPFFAGRYGEHLANWREDSSWHYHQDDCYFFDMS